MNPEIFAIIYFFCSLPAFIAIQSGIEDLPVPYWAKFLVASINAFIWPASLITIVSHGLLTRYALKNLEGLMNDVNFSGLSRAFKNALKEIDSSEIDIELKNFLETGIPEEVVIKKDGEKMDIGSLPEPPADIKKELEEAENPGKIYSSWMTSTEWFQENVFRKALNEKLSNDS